MAQRNNMSHFRLLQPYLCHFFNNCLCRYGKLPLTPSTCAVFKPPIFTGLGCSKYGARGHRHGPNHVTVRARGGKVIQMGRPNPVEDFIMKKTNFASMLAVAGGLAVATAACAPETAEAPAEEVAEAACEAAEDTAEAGEEVAEAGEEVAEAACEAAAE